MYDYHRLFVKIDRILSANPTIHLKNIAQQLQCSHPTVEKAIKINTGLQFRDYKNNKILKQGINLWKQGFCVKYIALELGYNWQDNFSRFFKKKNGYPISKLNAK